MSAVSPQMSSPNPLPELISDDLFKILEEHNLLNEKGVRDYHIRKRFRELRAQGIPSYEAIESLRDEYAYLQFDTLRKIVYGLGTRR
jgi:hypothetical protein